MKLPMPYSPLSLSEVHRRRAQRSQFLVQPASYTDAEYTENAEELEEQA